MSNKTLQDHYNMVCENRGSDNRIVQPSELYDQVYNEDAQVETKVSPEDLYSAVYTPSINENGQVTLNEAYERVMLSDMDINNVNQQREELIYDIPDKYFEK